VVPETCVYCRASVHPDEITVDHVIARSWFPSTTPDNTEKWKVPACRSCNNKFSRDEQDLLLRLAHCADPKHPAASDIYTVARRSIDLSRARDARDRARRESARRRFVGSVRDIAALPSGGVLPSFSGNYFRGSRTAIVVPARLLNGVVEKWTRGLHFVLLGEPVRTSGTVTVLHLRPEAAKEITGVLRQSGTVHNRGPGVEVMQLSASENGQRESIYRYLIWQQFQSFATVTEE